jgi:G6PDH family F420-dependent oxidoreductase
LGSLVGQEVVSVSEIGAFLSSEEHGPRALLEQAKMAEAAGMRGVFVSDHFHPWLDAQGQSPFVWSVIGGIAASTSLDVITGVTCPTVRIHPAVLAQAAATSQSMLEGRFVFGVGSGEALNEHILGHRWPPAATRLEMLEEAVEVIRKLWQGSLVTHHGRYYTVENARLYTLPDSPPPIAVSAFGPEATTLAAKIGDGFVNTTPNGQLLQQYREQGGTGESVGALKVCWGRDEGQARKMAHHLWPTEGVEGQLSQELALPSHFEAAAANVTEDMVAEAVPCGPDPERHVKAIEKFAEAGFDKIYVNQIGPEQEGFFDFYAKELRPRLAA